MRLRYWMLLVLRVLLTALIGTVAISLYMTLINSDMGILDAVKSLPLNALSMCGMSIYLWNSTAIRAQLPVAVGFGSTRKEALAGLQLERLISALLLTGILALTTLVGGSTAEAVRGHLLAAFAALFALGAVGDLFGLAYDRFNTRGIILFMVIASLLVMFFAIQAIGSLNTLPQRIDLYAVLAAAVLWGVDFCIQVGVFRRYAVHF